MFWLVSMAMTAAAIGEQLSVLNEGRTGHSSWEGRLLSRGILEARSDQTVPGDKIAVMPLID